MRAHDESEGEFSTLGVIEQYDCKAWANWAVERFGEEKSIFFMGVSTGASIAMMSSNLGLPKSVRGIIDDCGNDRCELQESPSGLYPDKDV